MQRMWQSGLAASLLFVLIAMAGGDAYADEEEEKDAPPAATSGDAGSAATENMEAEETKKKAEERSAVDESVEEYIGRETEGEPRRYYPTMGEIVVTAPVGVPLEYPGGRDIIEPEDLDETPSGNIQDLLRSVPGVYVQPESANDGRVNVSIRGNDPRRSGQVTLLIDGIPSTEGPYGQVDQDSLPITMERMYRVDVIRGGASIRYGPNSGGGVINFITEPIPIQPMLRVSGRYGSYNDNSLWTSAGGTWDNFGVLLTAVTKGGNGFRDRNSHRIDDLSAKFSLALTERDTLAWSVSFYTEDSQAPWGLSEAAYEKDRFQSTYVGGHFEAKRQAYTLSYTRTIDDRTYLGIEGWWKDLDRQLINNYPATEPRVGYSVQDTWSDAGALELRYACPADLPWFGTDFFVNGRFFGEKVGNHYYHQPFGGAIEKPLRLNAIGTTFSYAVFAEDTMHLSDTVDWSVGGRAEALLMSSKNRDDGATETQEWFLFLPETHVEWEFVPDSVLYGSYQESFGPPQYETGFDPESDFYQRTEPEKAYLWEFGARSRSFEGLDSFLTFFYTRWEDRLQFVNLPNGNKEAYNSGTEKHYGIEASAAYDLGKATDVLEGFGVYGTVTWIHAEITNGEFKGNRPPNAPEWMASWGARYEHPLGFWARLGGDYQGSAYKDPANTPKGTADGQNGPVPAFVVWDASIGWREHPDGSGFSAGVGVTNIFDEEYFRRFVGGKFTGAPRQFFVTAGYEWRF